MTHFFIMLMLPPLGIQAGAMYVCKISTSSILSVGELQMPSPLQNPIESNRVQPLSRRA